VDTDDNSEVPTALSLFFTTMPEKTISIVVILEQHTPTHIFQNHWQFKTWKKHQN
jgi:hypothetical protein